MTANVQQLSKRIEEVVHEHLAACRREAEAALVRAFGSGSRKSSGPGRSGPSSKSENRRSTSGLATLRERLYAVVLAKPGETIALLALEMNSPARELQFPMRGLTQTKRVRSAGQRGFKRYFPMGAAKAA